MLHALCSLSSIWNTIMDKYVTGLPDETKKQVGTWTMVVALVLFAFSLKSAKKGQVVGNWLMFWLASAVLFVSILYIVY